MRTTRRALPLALGLLMTGGVLAQTPATEVQRNANQQQRIEQGLQSGQLTTHEAARLEAGEARVNRIEGRALGDGTLSAGEARRIRAAQNAESRAIARQKHDAQTGNPASASSRRMQADVQRNANQQRRIEQGAVAGSLTNKEVAQLERGQAHVERREARAGIDGHVGAAGQASIQHAENVQSARIHARKHNAVAR